MRARRGFTLVETLVVIAVIAILLGITIPVLRRALTTAEEVTDLTNLRSTHQQFYEWGIEHKDRFVNLGPPPPGERLVIGAGPGNGFVVTSYFGQTRYWPLILARWGAPGVPSWHSVSTVIPEEPNHLGNACKGGRYVRETQFIYSANFLTSPGRWVSPVCMETAGLARFNTFVQWAQVVYPSDKGLMIDEIETNYDADTPTAPPQSPVCPVSFVDGSAASMDTRLWIGSSMDCPEGALEPVVNTPYGYLGRDFSR